MTGRLSTGVRIDDLSRLKPGDYVKVRRKGTTCHRGWVDSVLRTWATCGSGSRFADPVWSSTCGITTSGSARPRAEPARGPLSQPGTGLGTGRYRAAAGCRGHIRRCGSPGSAGYMTWFRLRNRHTAAPVRMHRLRRPPLDRA